MLEGFDKWNTGIKNYTEFVNEYYDPNANSSSLDERDRNMTEYIQEMEKLFDEYEIKKKYFDNILIRENWAALHYRYTREKNQ